MDDDRRKTVGRGSAKTSAVYSGDYDGVSPHFWPLDLQRHFGRGHGCFYGFFIFVWGARKHLRDIRRNVWRAPHHQHGSHWRHGARFIERSPAQTPCVLGQFPQSNARIWAVVQPQSHFYGPHRERGRYFCRASHELWFHGSQLAGSGLRLRRARDEPVFVLRRFWVWHSDWAKRWHLRPLYCAKRRNLAKPADYWASPQKLARRPVLCRRARILFAAQARCLQENGSLDLSLQNCDGRNWRTCGRGLSRRGRRQRRVRLLPHQRRWPRALPLALSPTLLYLLPSVSRNERRHYHFRCHRNVE